MPDATITSTASTFGTISGTFAADQSTITGTITAITGTVDGSVGVPGPQGPAGAAGVGVPAAGNTGQVLQKLSATSYDTGWLTLPADYITSVTAPLDVTSGNLTVDLSAYLPLAGGYMTGAIFNTNAIGGLYLNNFSLGAGWYTNVSWSGIQLSGGSGPTAQSLTIQGDGITFPGGGISKQTVAYPGAAILFDNAALTGNPTAPTPATLDDDTSIATTAFVKAQGYLTSAPVTSVAGRTGAITLSNTDISGLGSLAVVNDAPSNGSQYARKNAAWDVVIPGDRYLTSSTTSNTVSNGNKTFTIGTGLSYTPTQNLTISYDASNHMHGEVLTYNSGTGVLTVDVNHHTGSGTYTAWVVNVGGVTPATSVAWGGITGTLSAQTDLQSALDLKANLASPTFTGTPTLPTGTIATTQSPGNNTTALATTAFVTAAVPAFATTAQVVAATSTTTALAPGNQGFLITNPRSRSLSFINSIAISGSGLTGGTSGPGAFSRQMYLNTLAVGRAAYIFGTIGSSNSGFGASTAQSNQVDFSKKVWLSGYAMMGHGGSPSLLGDANTMCRITLGGYSTNTTGDMTLKGIGLKKVGGVASTVSLTVHDGTTRTDVASSVTIADGAGIHWQIYSDGTGNVTLYINGTQAATTTAGPTTATASGQACYREQVEAVATPGVRQVMNCNGGWFYTE